MLWVEIDSLFELILVKFYILWHVLKVSDTNTTSLQGMNVTFWWKLASRLEKTNSVQMLQLTCCREFCNLSAIFRAKMLSLKVFNILKVWYNSKSYKLWSSLEQKSLLWYFHEIYLLIIFTYAQLWNRNHFWNICLCVQSLFFPKAGEVGWVPTFNIFCLNLSWCKKWFCLGPNRDCQTSPEACL